MPLDPGRVETFQGALPDSAVRAAVHVTDLGDPLFVMVLVAAVYLFVDYRRGSLLMGVTFAGYGLTVAPKELLAVPRPPAELQVVAASGFGIPSGHALGAVVVFGGLAEELEAGTRRQRYAVAAVLAALVAVSRVVLGVHYLVDVVAGVLLGAGVLAAVYRFDLRQRPLLFGVGAVGSLAAMVLSGLTYAATFVLFGLAVGGLLAWPVVTPFPEPSRNVAIGTGAVALPVAVLVVPMGPTVLLTPLTVVPLSVLAIVLILVAPNVAVVLERAGRTPG